MSIENVTGYNATQYNLLLEQAQSHGVSSAKVEEAMLQAIQAKEKETQDKVNKEKAQVLKSRQKEKNW